MPVLQCKKIGLDIGSRNIKWVLFSNGKSSVLYDWGVLRIPDGWVRDGRIINQNGIAAGINKILKGLGCKVSGASISLSCPEMIIRTVRLPRLSTKELDSVVKYETEQLIPAGTGEYITDYRILGEEMLEGAAQVRVLIAALPSAIVAEYLELLRNLGLKPIAFDFHGNSVSRIVKMINNSAKGERQVVVDAGASTTTVTIVGNGFPVFTRLIQNGGDEVTKAVASTFHLTLEEAEQQKEVHGLVCQDDQKPQDQLAMETSRSIMPSVERLLKDIYRSIEFFKSISGHDMDSIITAGGGSRLKGLGCYFASGMGLKEIPIDGILPPLAKGEFSPEQAAVFINVLGLALRDGRENGRDINLLPGEYRDARQKRRAKGVKVITGILVCAAAAGAVILPLYIKNCLESRSTGILHEIGNWNTVLQYRAVKVELEQLLAEREELVLTLNSLGREWSSFFEEIGENTPAGIRLESVKYSDGGLLNVCGIAPDYNTMAKFVVNLQNMEGIAAAEPVGIAMLEDGVLTFEVICEVGG